MELPGIDVEQMRKAIQIFLDVAWGTNPRRPKLAKDPATCGGPEEILALYQRDSRAGTMRRYTLRLGNDRYPFMKLVFQELIIRDRFFFSVDTHDAIEVKDSFKDYEQWLEVKRYNASIRDSIEAAWHEAGVPIFADVVAQVERETPPGPAVALSAPLILIVDDDVGIAQGVHAVLSRNGYRTRLVHSAEAALVALSEQRPDLILSDLEMGGMSGLEFAAKVRELPEIRRVPFILATAASIGSTNFHLIDGFLVKPYDSDLLLKFLSTHLPRFEREGAPRREDASP